MVGVWAMVAAIATARQTHLAQFWERQLQGLFFELRGPVEPPKDVVILAMDADSLSQGTRIYPTDPQKYAFLEPLQTFPWKRTAYAQAITRLMAEGAKAVALDIVLDASSNDSDDEQLRQTLAQHPGRVVLAALYEDDHAREGSRTQLILPNPIFQSASAIAGFINYPIAANGQIQNLGSQFPLLVASTYPPPVAAEFLKLSQQTPSFAEATLKAAQVPYPTPGTDIYFYGPDQTFPQIPFWQVLDPTSWQMHQQQGTFRDKIVLIGPTAEFFQDFHAAPFSGSLFYPHKMAGVELQANAIATLLQNKSLRPAIAHPWLQGVLVLVLVCVGGAVQNQSKRPMLRFLWAVGAATLWASVCYAGFTYAGFTLPVAIPMLAIVLTGSTYLLTGSIREYLSKRQLKQTIKHYAASPIVQEILSQQTDEELRNLLLERERETFGKTLAGRYRIVKVLGSGGFGETYVAADTQRPGSPLCVVKQLRPSSNDLKILHLARRLFQREAEVLEVLGKHNQIPQLLAYFEEEDEFYLVQEFIEGHSLSVELPLGRHMPEVRVMSILRDVLHILEYVHSQGVIHRDIKPSNLIRRNSDGKLVLIDFGAVKQVSQMAEPGEESAVTVGIGTQGYMPNEQCGGKPRFNSDIYALGMTAIQALTGLPPSQLQQKEDVYTGELYWRDRATVSQALAEILSRMVRRDYRKRYQTVTEVLQDLNRISTSSLPASADLTETDFSTTLPLNSEIPDTDPAFANPTRPWPKQFATDPEEATEATTPYPLPSNDIASSEYNSGAPRTG